VFVDREEIKAAWVEEVAVQEEVVVVITLEERNIEKLK
jgi:hypothetical protein